MKDIVIEIDGVRHKLVEAKDNSRCDSCSLQELCDEAWINSMDCNICGSLMIDIWHHFVLESR